MHCSACCIHVDLEKASFASLAELELFPLYPCDTWPTEWLHTAQCTYLKHCTVHTVQSSQCKCTHLQTSKAFPALRPKSCAHKYCACHLSEIAEGKQNLTPSSSFPFKELPDQTEKYAKWKICKIRNNKI